MLGAMSRVRQWEQRTEWPLTTVALLFLGAFAWPILDSSLDGVMREVCRYTDYGAWAIFGVDYLIRLCLAENRLNYAGRHILDLLMLALPVLRPLRLLRVVLLLKFINRRAAQSLRGRVALYVISSIVLVVFCASLAELDAERHSAKANITSIGDALWWAITTVSTVGYGDHFPVTTEGRFVAAGLMLAGVALLGVVTASIASWLIDRVREVETETQAATRADLALLRTEIHHLRLQLADQHPARDADRAAEAPD
jgi:voltage-gated potassium channel